jgi:NAD(P)-dependent dehydrogenase (short-subunit alcohol dehydrogenase family)
MGMENKMLDSVDGLSDMMRALIPLQMVCDPADHAGSYVLLASKENSRAITGVVINSDGGIGIRGLTQAAGGVHL